MVKNPVATPTQTERISQSVAKHIEVALFAAGVVVGAVLAWVSTVLG